MKTFTFEQTITSDDVNTEDGGCAKIIQIDGDDTDEGLFVRIQSWSDAKEHPDFDALIGRSVRVTIEYDEHITPLAPGVFILHGKR
jgi:hypothetical protein